MIKATTAKRAPVRRESPDVGCSRADQGLAQRVVHLLALSGLAVAHPLLDLLARHEEFFVIRRFSPHGLVAMVVLLVLVVPAPFLMAELAVGPCSRKVRNGVHVAIVAVYAFLLWMLILKRIEALPAFAVVATAVTLAVVTSFAYARKHVVRMFVSMLAIGLVAIPAAFFLQPQVSRLLSARDTAISSYSVACETPILFVVFDEFSLLVLLDEHDRINPHRYPNLAAFAERATWYRNAITVAEVTRLAVPAILSGMSPTTERLPSVEDHPDNLFTLLAATHELWVQEPVTDLCPSHQNRHSTEPHWAAQLLSISRDLGIIYLHLLLPDDLAERVPAISYAWSDFGAAAQGQPRRDSNGRQLRRRFWTAALRAMKADRVGILEALLAKIGRGPTPQLHFLHFLLPHRPWEFTPDGRRYPTDGARGVGLNKDVWSDSPYLPRQAYQRYILQTMFVDTAVGRIMARLEELDLFDRYLIVLVADHGVSFTPGEHIRLAGIGNAHEILPVPLLVKAPHQKSGRVVDNPVATIDIMPTILGLLGLGQPWKMDGVIADDEAATTDRTLSFVTNTRGTHAVKPEYLASRDEFVAAKIGLYGDGSDRLDLFRVGPRGDMVGRLASEFQHTGSGDTIARVKDAELYRDVAPDSEGLPCFLRATLERLPEKGPDNAVAVAVNGVIGATAIPHNRSARAPLTAVLPPHLFVEGENTIEIFLIQETNLGVALRPVPVVGGTHR